MYTTIAKNIHGFNPQLGSNFFSEFPYSEGPGLNPQLGSEFLYCNAHDMLVEYLKECYQHEKCIIFCHISEFS